MPSTYSLPIASDTVLGGVKVGTGLSVDVDGVINSTFSPNNYVFGNTAATNVLNGIDLNILMKSGFYYANGGCTNTPETGSILGNILNLSYDGSGYGAQIMLKEGKSDLYFRGQTESTWRA